MVSFIDQHKGTYGVEPICRVLPIAPSTHFKRKAEDRDSTRRSARAQQDAILRAIIQRIWNEHHKCMDRARSGSRWAARISERPDAACGT
jgi:putative transposase